MKPIRANARTPARGLGPDHDHECHGHGHGVAVPLTRRFDFKLMLLKATVHMVRMQ
jgi:hypothetical protein